MVITVRHTSRRMRNKARKYKAFLNGMDVTHLCWYADDKAGVVHLYLTNSNGNKYIVYSSGGKRIAAWKKFHGKVKLVPQSRLNKTGGTTSSGR